MSAFVGLSEMILALADKDLFFTMLHSDLLSTCICHSTKAMRMCMCRGLNAKAIFSFLLAGFNCLCRMVQSLLGFIFIIVYYYFGCAASCK
jgi:hypothetical protein